MSRLWLTTLFAAAIAALSCNAPSAASLKSPWHLPAWPIKNIGDAISDGMISSWRGDYCPAMSGRFAAFPSKGNKCAEGEPKCAPPREKKKADIDDGDPDTLCDDGDQTTYNGLLCASGETDGCDAVARAQDTSGGRWFRSPHRLWLSRARCSELSKSDKTKRLFNDNCAYGFSPDMNLGVLLYTLKTQDISRYKKWLSWLDGESHNTKLCTLDKDRQPTTDCLSVQWPRICTDDIGHLNPDESPGYAVGNRYGGKCALRPFDALDFSAVNTATGVAYPPSLSAWDIESRGILKGAQDIASAVPGGFPFAHANPVIVMSSIDSKHYPTHLDAIRVLVRMMIQNPSMQLNNLPDLPNPEDILPKIKDIGVSDGTDLITIKLSANTIAIKVPWDPFYQLLANGPTPDVRETIINHCPAKSDMPDRREWIWEKGNETDGSKLHSMGWDCVFLGKLYNKMRIKKAVVDELFALFVKYGDGIGKALTKAQEGLQLAQAGEQEARKSLDLAKHTLDDVTDFVNRAYDQQKGVLNKNKKDLEDKIASASEQVATFNSQLADSAKSLALCVPTNITVPGTRCVQKVAGKCVLFAPTTSTIANPACQPIKSAVEQLSKSVKNAQGIVTANRGLVDGIDTKIGELDRVLNEDRKKLQKGALKTAYDLAKADFDLRAKVLAAAQEGLSKTDAAYKRVRNYMCVWRNDAKCEA